MLIIGHRGARALEPENTLRSLEKGMECADCVEVDVRLSRDNEPVVIHDRTLDRTTNGRGQVSALTVHQLQELDAGKGEKIPILQEVLDLVLGRSALIIEIKETGSEERVCTLIKERGMENIMLVSFSSESLQRVKELLPGSRTGLIYSKDLADPVRHALVIGADALLPKYELVSTELVEQAHRHGLMVFPWTLNNEDEITRAMDIGVDGFASDDPCFARGVVRSAESQNR